MENELNDASRRRAGWLATLSSCCGVTGETALTDSAVIILYAAALNAGDSLTLVSTSLLPFFNGLLIIPAAYLATRIGRRRLILGACYAATLAYLLAASAPFFHPHGITVLMVSMLLFTLMTPGFIACWNPLLDSFLRADERVGYLGRMRFLHQLSAIAFLSLAGKFLGTAPEMWKLQAVVFAGAIVFCGRGFAISQIPEFPSAKRDVAWLEGLRVAWHDRRLTCFSVYQFLLNLLIYGGIPVTTLALKNSLKVSGDSIVYTANAGLVGMLSGYCIANLLRGRVPWRMMFITLHLLSIIANLALAFALFLGGDGVVLWGIAALLWLLGAVVAASSVYCSAEMMRLSPAGNKIMAMAWSCMFFYCGCGCSRLLPSFLLNIDGFRSGLMIGSVAVSPYQALLLLYGMALVPVLLLLFKAVGRSES